MMGQARGKCRGFNTALQAACYAFSATFDGLIDGTIVAVARRLTTALWHYLTVAKPKPDRA
jgi:hypothetical protein